MSGFTPGPWSVVRRRDGAAIAPVGLVALGVVKEADLQLAAAAPDLVRAVEVLLWSVARGDEPTSPASDAAIAQARATLILAVGEEVVLRLPDNDNAAAKAAFQGAVWRGE